jgi:hypothetical protein
MSAAPIPMSAANANMCHSQADARANAIEGTTSRTTGRQVMPTGISANVPTIERQWYGQPPGFLRLMSLNHSAEQPARPDKVRLVSVVAWRPRSAPGAPMTFPSSGKVSAEGPREGQAIRFRRVPAARATVISYLGTFDRLFGSRSPRATVIPSPRSPRWKVLRTIGTMKGLSVN